MSIHASTVARPRVGVSPISNTMLRRLVWSVLPAVLVIGFVQMALLGDDGLLKRHHVKQRLYTTHAKVEQVQQLNASLAARVRLLRTNPTFVERTVGERLLLAREGGTIYRFEGPIR
jgi:cell division protein FtsB